MSNIVALDIDIMDAYDRDLLVTEMVIAFQISPATLATAQLALDTEPSEITEMFGRKRPAWWDIPGRRKWNKDIVLLKGLIRDAIDALPNEDDIGNNVQRYAFRES